MAAKVTFCNLNGKTQPAPFVSLHTERVRTEPEPITMTTASSVDEVGVVKRRHGSSSEENRESSVDQPAAVSLQEGEEDISNGR